MLVDNVNVSTAEITSVTVGAVTVVDAGPHSKVRTMSEIVVDAYEDPPESGTAMTLSV